jgi:hypothetical protein
MNTSTLIQSCLLAAGLLLCGTSPVHADRVHATIPSGGNYHSLRHDSHSPGHTPQWSSGHPIPGRASLRYHGKPYGKHKFNHHENRDRGQGYGHGGNWQYGKHDGRGFGRDRQGHWHQGKYEARYYAGRRGHHPRSGGIGYTGRS